ncbi:MAG: glycosyltransferase [Pseudomonadota bacterium]
MTESSKQAMSDHAEMLSVSVVLAVFDSAEQVRQTIDSVLKQQGVSLEFIVVDDGASTAVKKQLEVAAADPRVTVLSQSNQGLTKALIAGCRAASHPYIARIDTGDRMLPGRLAAQAAQLQRNPKLAMVSSWVDVVTLEGYELYTVKNTAEQLQRGLTSSDPASVVTPFHASVMFRQSSYIAVGGYRTEFYFAQDYDLWSRMIRHGGIDVLPETFTLGVFSASGISGQYAAEQQALKEIVIQLASVRSAGKSEHQLLEQAAEITKSSASSSSDEFAGLYFIGCCLMDTGSEHAGDYLTRALRARPWSLKGWVRYLRWRLSA